MSESEWWARADSKRRKKEIFELEEKLWKEREDKQRLEVELREAQKVTVQRQEEKDEITALLHYDIINQFMCEEENRCSHAEAVQLLTVESIKEVEEFLHRCEKVAIEYSNALDALSHPEVVIRSRLIGRESHVRLQSCKKGQRVHLSGKKETEWTRRKGDKFRS